MVVSTNTLLTRLWLCIQAISTRRYPDHRRPDKPQTMSSSTSTLKARHYAALSSSLRRLQSDLGESEIQMVRLADHLESMQKMGTYSAAQ